MKYRALFTMVVGFFLVAQTASAVTSPSDVLLQIQKLQAQLEALQKQTSSQQPSAVKVAVPMASEKAREVASPNASFNRDLSYGMKGDTDVSNLQEFLISKGYLTGTPTGNYFLMTVAAVKKFQSANGVNPTGYFGPKSRAIMNEMVRNEIGTICFSESCDDTIEKPIVGTVEEKFYIDPWNIEMRQGGQVNVAAYIQYNPANCANCGAGVPQKVAAQWHASDANIVTVTVNNNNTDAVVYGLKAGRATVTAVYTNSAGKSVKASISVKVLGDVSHTQVPLVLSPNGGELWTKGTTQTIKWSDSVSAAPAYDIQLIPYQQPCTGDVCILGFPAPYTIAKGVSGTSYQWSVGAVMDSRTVMDGAFTIQVCRTGTSQCDSSNSYFKISGGVSAPKLTVMPASFPKGKVGSFYQTGPYVVEGSQTIPTDAYEWVVSEGKLPPGLTLVGTLSATVIQGTPTAAGSTTFTLTGKRLNTVLSKQYTIVIEPSLVPLVPSIYIAASGAGHTGESISVNLGEEFVISGTPKNLTGQYWHGSGMPPQGYWSRAYMFDQFGSQNGCVTNEATIGGEWLATCSAKVPGSGHYYINIYANGQTYSSNKVYVTVSNTSAPSGVLSIIPFESKIKAGESVSLGAFYQASIPFCPNCGAPVPVPVNVTWSVSDPNIISVSNGVVKGLSAGEAKVYADYAHTNGEVIKAGAYVKVEPNNVTDPILPPATFSLSAPKSIDPGTTFTVTWSNAVNTTPKDWVTIVPATTQWVSGHSWAYTDGLASGSKNLTASSNPGPYDIVYYKDNGFTEVKRIGVVVGGLNVVDPILPTSQSAKDAELASMLSIAQAWLDELAKGIR